MATLRPNSYIADVVSILFYKNNRKIKYLCLDLNNSLTLPCSKVLEETWSETADHLQDFVFGKKIDKKILKIIKGMIILQINLTLIVDR